MGYLVGFIFGGLLLVLGALIFAPEPTCQQGYVYVWRSHACLAGYRP